MFKRRFIMKSTTTAFIACVFLLAVVFSTSVFGADYTHNYPGLSGYDPVSYFMDGKPMKGSGFHVTSVDGVTYAFASKEHKELFEANPNKYLPAYGGYCAYGMAIKKKFVADPEVWEIVDGILYLNLDKSIQGKWAMDKPGYIKGANSNWKEIKDKAPSDL